MSDKIFLNPGDFYFGDSVREVHTLLGSCVAITLWHPTLHLGGMCHYVLPRLVQEVDYRQLDCRYGNEAILRFKQECQARGTWMRDYQVKLFGASQPVASAAQASQSIGYKNLSLAYEGLAAQGVEVLLAHTGKNGSRRIYLDLHTGDVWVKFEPIVLEPAQIRG